VKAVYQRGHEIVGHSYAEDTQLIHLTEAEERDEIRTCAQMFQEFVGMRPTGWLTSGMRHTERTLGILADEGFAWHGDAVNDDNPYPVNINGKTMIIVPYKNAISGLNDTGMYRRGITARDVFNSFKDEFELLYESKNADSGDALPDGISSHRQGIRRVHQIRQVVFRHLVCQAR
jgi:hypothetical protein